MLRRRIDCAELFLKLAVLLGFLGIGLGMWSNTAFLIFICLAGLSCVASIGMLINREPGE